MISRPIRVPVMMSDDELRAVDTWRSANRNRLTRAKAIRDLVKIGLHFQHKLASPEQYRAVTDPSEPAS